MSEYQLIFNQYIGLFSNAVLSSAFITFQWILIMYLINRLLEGKNIRPESRLNNYIKSRFALIHQVTLLYLLIVTYYSSYAQSYGLLFLILSFILIKTMRVALKLDIIPIQVVRK